MLRDLLLCGHELHPVPAARRRSAQIQLSTFINVFSFLGSVAIVLLMMGVTIYE